ncbi:hypothetical protein ALC60_07687, partial [Trachymyrmex zeteki]
EKKGEKEEQASKFRTLSGEKRPRGFPEAGTVVKFEWLVSRRDPHPSAQPGSAHCQLSVAAVTQRRQPADTRGNSRPCGHKYM